jgi:glutathione S-transferase
MSLTLYYHPLASFCHKVLMALYENETPFTGEIIDLSKPDHRSRLLEVWPVGKFPVLRDEKRDRTVPESSIIIEYLDREYPGARPLLPAAEDPRLETRLWDRFFDSYVQTPMQKIVGDRLRPEGERDPLGVKEAVSALNVAYGMIERQLATRTWIAGEHFTMADCAAAPALFYAGIVAPFAPDHPNTMQYFDRLTERASFRRLIDEARPYFANFPFRERIPARFL